LVVVGRYAAPHCSVVIIINIIIVIIIIPISLGLQSVCSASRSNKGLQTLHLMSCCHQPYDHGQVPKRDQQTLAINIVAAEPTIHQELIHPIQPFIHSFITGHELLPWIMT